jgi:hypothetical protein
LEQPTATDDQTPAPEEEQKNNGGAAVFDEFAFIPLEDSFLPEELAGFLDSVSEETTELETLSDDEEPPPELMDVS